MGNKSKSPAFLFYSSDFLIGTSLLDNSEVGQYVRLLCHIHQQGHLTREEVGTVVPLISPKVLAKFKIDDDGKYYNERLDEEISKRNSFVTSRKQNLTKKFVPFKTSESSHIGSHVSSHMKHHVENENENEIGNNKTDKVQQLLNNIGDINLIYPADKVVEMLTADNYAKEHVMKNSEGMGEPAYLLYLNEFVGEQQPTLSVRPYTEVRLHFMRWGKKKWKNEKPHNKIVMAKMKKGDSFEDIKAYYQ